MESRYTASTKAALVLLAAIFALQVYQAARLPINGAEAYSYDRFVRPTIRQILGGELPNHDGLYTLLEKRSVGLFHVSPFSVRLPSLLFALLYLWSIWNLGRLALGTGRLFLAAVVLAAVLPIQFDCFTRANGIGMAFALEVCAISLSGSYLLSKQKLPKGNLNLAGACLGLAVAARWEFAIPSVVLALALLGALLVKKSPAMWPDRILIPALVISLIFLVLPMSHAHASPESTPDLSPGQRHRLESIFQVLRASAGTNHIRIGASSAIEPILNFYRAQDRIVTWDRATRSLPSEDVDYYFLCSRDIPLVEPLRLIVLYQDADFLLARRSHD